MRMMNEEAATQTFLLEERCSNLEQSRDYVSELLALAVSEVELRDATIAKLTKELEALATRNSQP